MTQRPQETQHGFNMRLAEKIYDLVEHGKMIEAAEVITQRQLDARISALEEAAEVANKSKTTAMGDMPDQQIIGATKAVKAILSLATKLKEGTR